MCKVGGGSKLEEELLIAININGRFPTKWTNQKLTLLSPFNLSLLFLLLLLNTSTLNLEAIRQTVDSSELNLDGRALVEVPSSEELCQEGQTVNVVNLANNKLVRLEARAFVCFSGSLKILNLRANLIHQIGDFAFDGLDGLQVLILEDNQLHSIPSKTSLEPLVSLKHLNLANNRIETIASGTFGQQSANLISLDLRGNPLLLLAQDSFVPLNKLKTLTLSRTSLSGKLTNLLGLNELHFLHLDRLHNITSVANNLCAESRKLSLLVLKSNRIELIPQFEQCQNLLLLDLSYNNLQGSLSGRNFSNHPNLIDLYLGHNRLEIIEEFAFEGLTKLQVLELAHNQLKWIHQNAFKPLQANLIELNIAANSHLSSLSGYGLEQLVSFRAYGNLKLRTLPHLPSARSLALTYAYHCCDYLDPGSSLTSGQESRLEENSLVSQLVASLLNKLFHFFGSSRDINIKDSNDEQRIRTDNDTTNLTELVVWPKKVQSSIGIVEDEKLEVWKSIGKREVNEQATRRQRLNRKRSATVATEFVGIEGGKLFVVIDEFARRQVDQIRLAHSVNLLIVPTTNGDYSPSARLISGQLVELENYNGNKMEIMDSREDRRRRHLEALTSLANKLECAPQPNAFLPCKDLFDTWWLRLGIWSVFLLAFTGNILVIVVLGSVRQSSSASALTSIMWLAHSKRHIDVPRFLVINLAIADLLMALYLGILAFVDISTLGEFKLFAIKWQYSAGCKLASFLGVLSSELSVFILAIITLERNYAITNAVHLNRRLSLQKAMLIMFIGYAFALLMAIMPLNGISDYRKFSICLPLDMDTSLGGKLYIITLLAINTFSFILLLSCYLRMYCAIRGSQAWNTNDIRIAKRMSILVLTDFLCWMPIIFVALASLFGYHLIGTNGIKIITIFVLPLNSVANPFLYAITTKKFKRDLDTLMRRARDVAAFANCNWLKDGEDTNDPKMFANYQHNQYQQNLMRIDRKRRLQKDAQLVGGSKNLAANNRQRFFTRAQTLNQVTINRTTCSCQRIAHMNHQRQLANDYDNTNATCELATIRQPRIVLESVALASFQREVIEEPEEIVESSNRLLVSNLRANGCLVIQQDKQLNPQVRASELVNGQFYEQQTTKLLIPRGVTTNERLTNKSPGSHQMILVDERPSADYLLKVDGRVEYRSASACGGYKMLAPEMSPDPSTGAKLQATEMVSVSCDAMRVNVRSREKLSRSINKLLFEPIAKAWSSIQISLASSATVVQNSDQLISTTNQANSENNSVTTGKESNNLRDKSINKEQGNSTTIEDILLLSSPQSRAKLRRVKERRMSRSCELIPKNGGENSQSSIGHEYTSTSHGDYDDDRRILLATINRITASRSGGGGDMVRKETNIEVKESIKDRYLKQRCTRCRSWSPALLDKLEDCIYQIKSRLPGFGNVTDLNHETMENRSQSTSSSDEEQSDFEDYGNEMNQIGMYENQVGGDRTSGEVEDSEDKFNEKGLVEWEKRRKSSVQRKYHFRKKPSKLQHQSSTNSDTLSTRTGGTIVTTISLSFDSNTNISNSGSHRSSEMPTTSCELNDNLNEFEP